MNDRFPAARSATLTASPAVTGVPLSVRLPDVGNVVITTAMKLSGGESWGSLNPKSAAVSTPAAVPEVPAGGWLTRWTQDRRRGHVAVGRAVVSLVLEAIGSAEIGVGDINEARRTH